MQFLYNVGIALYGLAIRLASLRSKKAQLWLRGRKNWQKTLRQVAAQNPKALWVHAASLGEMEQGLPIVQSWQKLKPKQPVVVSFFSPSGFENFKADQYGVTKIYLPLDTAQNARAFVQILKPAKAIFIKYEIWLHFFKQLKRAQIPFVLAPALFRESQFYFKSWVWPFYKPYFKSIHSIFTQNAATRDLLRAKGLENVKVCGDPRFDRVLALSQKKYTGPALQDFAQKHFTLIGGSTWPQEEKLLVKVLEQFEQLKLVIAPHEVNPENIKRVAALFEPFGLSYFSQQNIESHHRVVLVDTIGHLSQLYRFGQFALVGGGFGQGVHSTVEPICHGLPVAFGPKHHKFIEPREMITRGIGFEISTAEELKAIIEKHLQKENAAQRQKKVQRYLEQKSGATAAIVGALEVMT
jgi:3-deoxy-D-manno-octulosonic-acid transferase